MDNTVTSMGNLALSQGMASRLNGTANSNFDKTAKDFTAVFFSQMLQPMFEGVGVDPMFGGGHGEEVMKSFLIRGLYRVERFSASAFRIPFNKW